MERKAVDRDLLYDLIDKRDNLTLAEFRDKFERFFGADPYDPNTDIEAVLKEISAINSNFIRKVRRYIEYHESRTADITRNIELIATAKKSQKVKVVVEGRECTSICLPIAGGTVTYVIDNETFETVSIHREYPEKSEQTSIDSEASNTLFTSEHYKYVELREILKIKRNM